MMTGVSHFSELSGTIPGLSDKMLSERLKELEARGVIVRSVIPETPVRIEYQLTEKGRALQDVVPALSAWASAWYEDEPAPERSALG